MRRAAEIPAAGGTGNARSVARVHAAIANGGTLDGVRLLSPTTVALMTADHLGGRYDVPGVGFGLGFSVVKEMGTRGTPGSAGEYGWGGAYHSTYWVDPAQELVVVYLTQVVPAAGLDDHGKVRALIYQALVGGAGR